MRFRWKKLLQVLCLLMLLYLLSVNDVSFIRRRNRGSESYCPGPNGPIDFTNFNNTVVGMENGCFIVPNYIHFVRFNAQKLNYGHMICYLSALKNQKPERFYIHYDNNETFTGPYWEILKNTPGFKDVVILNYAAMPKEVFGQELNPGWAMFHGSDLMRIRALMTYGGIYLDNDMFLVKSVDPFRHFEMTLGWEYDHDGLGNQLLIAHKDARFLKIYLELYRGDYRPGDWLYNSAARPSTYLNSHPHLVHRIDYMFGNDDLGRFLYTRTSDKWTYYYSMHILFKHFLGYANQEIRKNLSLPDYLNENTIPKCNITFREMALSVYNPTGINI